MFHNNSLPVAQLLGLHFHLESRSCPIDVIIFLQNTCFNFQYGVMMILPALCIGSSWLESLMRNRLDGEFSQLLQANVKQILKNKP